MYKARVDLKPCYLFFQFFPSKSEIPKTRAKERKRELKSKQPKKKRKLTVRVSGSEDYHKLNFQKWNDSAELIGDYGEYTLNDWVDQWLNKRQNKFWIEEEEVFDLVDSKLRVTERAKDPPYGTSESLLAVRCVPLSAY